MPSLLINHVMSSSQDSKIFKDILGYFSAFSPPEFSHLSSETPLGGALIRHYHRPQLESRLIAPCVVTVHHDLADTDAWLDLQKFLPRYREASMVVCLNQTQQALLAAHGIEHTVVIAHGFNTELIRLNRAPPRSWNGKIQIAIISKRYARKVKGESYLFELAKIIDKERFAFVLIGQGRLACARHLESLGFEVTCLENAPYSVVADFYQKIDFLMMISRYEGGPACIPEAVAAGVPILCNPIAMARDMVQPGVNGLYLSMDAQHDADHVFARLGDEDLLRQLKQGALSRSTTASSWQHSVSRNCAVYTELLKQMFSAFK
jgi:glycosyltransferase involved in cell wall biosynthesis